MYRSHLRRFRAPNTLLAMLLAVTLVSGCVSARMRNVQSAASANVTALASVGAVYDAALTARYDATSASLLNLRGNEVSPAPTGGALATLRAQNTDQLLSYGRTDLQYRDYVSTLRRHSALLSSYFATLQDYSAPGANSATKHTDAQLAQAGGIVTALTAVNKEIELVPTDRVEAVLSTGLRLILEGIADQRLRDHVQAHGRTVVDGLLIQEQAMRALTADLEENRRTICNRSLNQHARTTLLTNAQTQETLAERRRTLLGCARGGAEAESAADALAASRTAFIEVLGDYDESQANADRDRTRAVLIAFKNTQPDPLADPTTPTPPGS